MSPPAIDQTSTIAVKAIINSREFRSHMVVAPVQSPLVCPNAVPQSAAAPAVELTTVAVIMRAVGCEERRRPGTPGKLRLDTLFSISSLGTLILSASASTDRAAVSVGGHAKADNLDAPPG